jgi:O-antigen/teichoic acid export membrane protein
MAFVFCYMWIFIDIWVGKRFWIGNVNNIIICVSIFILTIGYNLSNITTSNGEMKGNSIVNILRSLVYIILLLLLGKLFGMIGILIAYLLSVSVMGWYYPIRVIKSLLERQDVKIVIKESLIIIGMIFLAASASNWFTLKLSLTMFVICSFLYAIVFFALLSLVSNLFRSELRLIGNAIKGKIKRNSNSIKLDA